MRTAIAAAIAIAIAGCHAGSQDSPSTGSTASAASAPPRPMKHGLHLEFTEGTPPVASALPDAGPGR